MLDISRGCRGAHADGLVMAIDPVEIAVEPAGTFAEPMKLIDNVGNEICDDLPERVRCPQRPHKAAPSAGELGGKDRPDWLAPTTQTRGPAGQPPPPQRFGTQRPRAS